MNMSQEKEQGLCEWCKKREQIYTCSYCGITLCKKCAVDTADNGYYCKSCVLSAVKSNQSCD